MLAPGDVERARANSRRRARFCCSSRCRWKRVRTVALGVALGCRSFQPGARARRPRPLALTRSRVLLPNQSELALLTDKPVTTIAEAEAAARTVIAAGIAAVRRNAGSRRRALRNGGFGRARARARVTPVDTSGAGDAFIGSFAHHYVATRDVTAALRSPVAYAADSVTRAARKSPMRRGPNSTRSCSLERFVMLPFARSDPGRHALGSAASFKRRLSTAATERSSASHTTPARSRA